jgi:hypothetical protein
MGVGGEAPYRAIFLGGIIKESPIFVKTYDFVKWLLEHTIKFPKSQRFVMAKRVEEAILNFYDLLILAVKEGGDKKVILNKAGFELERLKHYLRLCKDLNVLNIRQYEYSSKEIVEIGRLLGGWLKKT